MEEKVAGEGDEGRKEGEESWEGGVGRVCHHKRLSQLWQRTKQAREGFYLRAPLDQHTPTPTQPQRRPRLRCRRDGRRRRGRCRVELPRSCDDVEEQDEDSCGLDSIGGFAREADVLGYALPEAVEVKLAEDEEEEEGERVDLEAEEGGAARGLECG